ncbi:MAG: hypothetical protein R3Y58_08990 [Eubacteriales bacterium]
MGNLFQTFYNIVDGVIVGRLLGVESLACGTAFLVVGTSSCYYLSKLKTKE